MRSKALVINEIAKRHDGGGHPLASGANSYSLERKQRQILSRTTGSCQGQIDSENQASRSVVSSGDDWPFFILHKNE